MIGAITAGLVAPTTLLVPNAPTIGTATGGSGQASVTFTPAATGPAATSYTAVSSPGGITKTGASSPLVVTGLTNGTAYTFTVYATNAYGNSASSAASNSVTPAIVTPPVSGYKVWLDATDSSKITASSGSVSQWTDGSANAYAFTQATSSYQPTTGTRSINGLNALDFDGTSDWLYSTAAISTWKFLHSTQSTIFIVMQSDISNAYTCVISTEAGSTSRVGFNLPLQSNAIIDAICDKGTAGSGVYDANSGISYNTSAMYATYKSDPANGTAANRIQISKNAGSYGGGNTLSNSPSTADSENSLTIGCNLDLFNGTRYPGSWFNGLIGEILIYDSALSSGDITSVQSYLATKWGL